jgi:hypothetical protein
MDRTQIFNRAQLQRRLTPVERDAQRAAQTTVPDDGREHIVVGPALSPPYFRCSCGAVFSNRHPPTPPSLPGAEERRERRQQVADWPSR